MPNPNDPSDLLASDLLPPDDLPSDPEVKRIAERRVAGWMTSARLMARNEWRPAGNSRRFWKKIEDDDPFLPSVALNRVAQSTHELYPSERLPRVESAKPRPKPAPRAPQQPQAKAKPTPQPKPEPVHTRDTQAVRTPTPRPTPAAEQPVDKPIIDRRPRILPNPELPRRPQGRMSVRQSRPSAAQPAAAPTQSPAPAPPPPPSRTADQIRNEKQATREAVGPPPPPVQRGLDSVLAMLGELRMAETLHNQGITGTSDADYDEAPRPKPKQPKPKPKAKATPAAQPPSPTSAPRQEAAPKPSAPAPSPPTPSPPPTTAPPTVDRSPSGSKGGGLDDLFGGPSEGRVRIGKRKAPKSGEPDS